MIGRIKKKIEECMIDNSILIFGEPTAVSDEGRAQNELQNDFSV